MSIALLFLQTINSDGWTLGTDYSKRYPDMASCAEDRRGVVSRIVEKSGRDLSDVIFCVDLGSPAELPGGVTVLLTTQLGTEPSEIQVRVTGPSFGSFTECRAALKITGTELRALCTDFTPHPDSEELMRREMKAALRLMGFPGDE